MSHTERLAWALVVALVTSGYLLAEAASETEDMRRRDAVERGYALYCPNTGEWAWKGECK